MNKLICLALCMLTFSIANAQNSNNGTHYWSFTITPATTHKSIDSLITDWKTHGIDLRFYKPEYNSKGQLVNFAGSVAYFKGKNRVGAKFDNLKNKTMVIEITDKPSVSVKAE